MSRSELLSLGRSTYGVDENCLIVTSRTGVIAAAAIADSIFWAFRPDYPSSILDTRVVLERLRLQYTCITAFTTPVIAGRELALCTLSQLPTPAGSASSIVRKEQLFGEGSSAGVALVSNTLPLVYAGDPVDHDDIFARVSLAGYGTAGATFIKEWRWDTGSAAMVNVPTDRPVAIIAPQAMDAAGTFELIIEADYQSLPTGYPDPV